jgi:CRISPR-associated protein Cmr5
MNKRKVDKLIPNAYEVLKTAEIVERDKDGNPTNKIDTAWRGQVASFGASIAQGSLLAAVSFFSKKSEKTKVDDRSKLTEAIFKLIEDADKNGTPRLFEYVRKKKDAGKEREAKENILNAAVALKLAMNLYDLGKGDDNGAEPAKNES